jgi:hypothetical protein
LQPFAFMSPMRQQGVRQALPRHSASRQVSTPQLTFGALEFQNTNTTKSLSLPPFVFMNPLRQQGGCVRHFHAIPHRAGLAPPPQLTFGALEFQNTNTAKSLSLPPFAFKSPLRQQGGAPGNSTLLRIAPGWHPRTHVAGS